MMEQLDLVSSALDRLEKMIAGLKQENDSLHAEIAQLKNTVDDRDLEILQLQEDAEKLAAAEKAGKEEVEKRLDTLIERINAIVPPELASEPETSANAQPQQEQQQEQQ